MHSELQKRSDECTPARRGVVTVVAVNFSHQHYTANGILFRSFLVPPRRFALLHAVYSLTMLVVYPHHTACHAARYGRVLHCYAGGIIRHGLNLNICSVIRYTTINLRNEICFASLRLGFPLRCQRVAHHRSCWHRLRQRSLLRLRADLHEQHHRSR